MNVRTGELALDVAFQHFQGEAPVALVIGYNGPAIPTREEVAMWNRPFLMGFESSTTRSYAGGDAGDEDSGYSAWKFDGWGYPRECGSWFCAADTPNTPAAVLPNIYEYGRLYALRQIAGERRGPITPYGNRDAVEAAAAGIRHAGLVAPRWGVGTWTGYGEGPDGVPPNLADVELLQSGNNPGPRDATDLDWLYAPVGMFAPMGGPTPPSPTQPAFGGDMDLYVGKLDQPGAIDKIPLPAHQPVGLLVSPSGRIVSTWAGPGPYGIPQGAVDWHAAPGTGRDRVNVIVLDTAQLVEVIAADAATRS